MAQLEGDAFSKLNAMFNEGGRAAERAAKIELATVTKSAPDIEIMLDFDGLKLDKDDLIVAEHLTQHKRVVTIRKTEDARFISDYPRNFNSEFNISSSQVDVSMSPASDGTPPHNINAITLNGIQEEFSAIDLELEYQDELKLGDRVLVACVDASMTYIIIDRARWYE